MSKTLVVVMTHGAALPILTRNLPWLRKSGGDIAIVNHEHDMVFPDDGQPLIKVNIGTDPDRMRHRWVTRFMDVLAWCQRESHAAPFYDNFCLTEADSIFVRPLTLHPGGIVATPAGYKSEGFRGSRFYHAPWWFQIIDIGFFLMRSRRMLAAGLDEQGFIDRFLGLYEDLYCENTIRPAMAFSRNSIETPTDFRYAREAIANGAYFLHGIKTAEALDAVTKGL